MRLAVLVCLMFVWCNAASVALGYVTGSDYVDMSDNEKKGVWLMGVLDGTIAESLPGSGETGPWLATCIREHEFRQLRAIFESYLRANPEDWHAPAAIIARGRLKEFCGE